MTTTTIPHSPRLAHRRSMPISRWSAWVGLSILLLLAAVGGVALFSLPVAGAIYFAIVLGLAICAPQYVYMIVFATSPLAWDVGGGPVNMAISEITLALAFPIFLLRTSPAGWARLRNPLWLAIGAYFLVCVFSSLANSGNIPFKTSITSLIQMGIYFILCIGGFSVCLSDEQSAFPAFYGLMASCSVLAVVAMVTRSGYILGLHKNLIGTELMYSVIIAFELWMARDAQRLPRRVSTAVLTLLSLGLIFTVSRGAWAGAFVGINLILFLRRQYRAAFQSLLLLIPIVIIGWFLLPESSRTYASELGTENRFTSASTRLISLEYAYTLFQSSPVYGVGVGLRKQYDATNLIMLMLAETGIVGLLAFLSVFIVLAYMAWQAQKRIPRDHPLFSLLAIGVAIMFSKFCHGLVDHYWSRGIAPVWASAGFLSFAYFKAMQMGTKSALQRRKL